MVSVASLRSVFARPWSRLPVRLLAYAAVLLTLAFGVFWFVFARDLPSVDKLKAYQPPLPTNVRGADGTPIYS